MTSNVDVTKPTEGRAYTADVRANFQIIKTEIETLQSHVGSVPGTDQYLLRSGGEMTGNLTFTNNAKIVTKSAIDGSLEGSDDIYIVTGNADGKSATSVPGDIYITGGTNEPTYNFERRKGKLVLDVASITAPTAPSGGGYGIGFSFVASSGDVDSLSTANAGGGGFYATAGASYGSGTAGGISLTAGNAMGSTSYAGNVTIKAGSNNPPGGGTNKGGSVSISAGDSEMGAGNLSLAGGYSGLVGGQVTIQGGLSGGGATGAGGLVYIAGGSIQGGPGNAGNIHLMGGTTYQNQYPVDGYGGNIILEVGKNSVDATKHGAIKMVGLPTVTQSDTETIWNNNGVLNIGAGGTPGGGGAEGGLPLTGGTMTGPIVFDSYVYDANKITTGSSLPTDGGKSLTVSSSDTEGNSGSVTLRTGNSTTSYSGFIGLYGGNSTSPAPNHYGGTISLNGGDGNTGGNISAWAGNANSPDGRGGRVSIRAGNSTEQGASSGATGRAGGGVWLWAGKTVTENLGGLVSIQAGDATDLRGVGGFVSIRSGKGLRSGSITIGCESGTSVSAESVIDTATPEGGNLNLYAGGGYNRGGDVQISAGDVFANTTATDPVAGDLLLLAGIGTSAPNSIGGDVFIQSGRGELQGGNISISIGTGTTPGSLLIANLPTVAQSVPTALWNNAGVMNIGAGGVAGGGGSGLPTTGGEMTGPITVNLTDPSGNFIQTLNGVGAGSGGNLRVVTGSYDPSGTYGVGGSVSFTLGDGTATEGSSSSGGHFYFTTGNNIAYGNGGNFNITTGNGSAIATPVGGANAGNFRFTGGTGNTGGRFSVLGGGSHIYVGGGVRFLAGACNADGIISPPNMGGMARLGGGYSPAGVGGLTYISGGSGLGGGPVVVVAGIGQSADGLTGIGGNLLMSAGRGDDEGGYVQITGGLGSKGPGGDVYIDGGNVDYVGNTNSGGRVKIVGGSSGPSALGIGGNVQINGGKGYERSGDVNISGGQPSDNSVAGLPGNVLIEGGNNYGVTPAKAGNVTIQGGSAAGVGPAGDTIIKGGPTSGGTGDEILQAGNLILSPGINPLNPVMNGLIKVWLPMVAQADPEALWNNAGVINIGAGGVMVMKADIDELNSQIATLVKRIVALEARNGNPPTPTRPTARRT
jgi:hypothetical protein